MTSTSPRSSPVKSFSNAPILPPPSSLTSLSDSYETKTRENNFKLPPIPDSFKTRPLTLSNNTSSFLPPNTIAASSTASRVEQPLTSPVQSQALMYPMSYQHEAPPSGAGFAVSSERHSVGVNPPKADEQSGQSVQGQGQEQQPQQQQEQTSAGPQQAAGTAVQAQAVAQPVRIAHHGHQGQHVPWGSSAYPPHQAHQYDPTHHQPQGSHVQGQVGQHQYGGPREVQAGGQATPQLLSSGAVANQFAAQLQHQPPPGLHAVALAAPGTPGGTLTPGGGVGPAKHTCPTCNQSFTRHHNLKSHLLTHSQEKPFRCQTCGHTFRRLHDLKRHSKLHTGEKPYVCPTCNRGFARMDALSRHLKSGSGECNQAAALAQGGANPQRHNSMPLPATHPLLQASTNHNQTYPPPPHAAALAAAVAQAATGASPPPMQHAQPQLHGHQNYARQFAGTAGFGPLVDSPRAVDSPPGYQRQNSTASTNYFTASQPVPQLVGQETDFTGVGVGVGAHVTLESPEVVALREKCKALEDQLRYFQSVNPKGEEEQGGEHDGHGHGQDAVDESDQKVAEALSGAVAIAGVKRARSPGDVGGKDDHEGHGVEHHQHHHHVDEHHAEGVEGVHDLAKVEV